MDLATQRDLFTDLDLFVVWDTDRPLLDRLRFLYQAREDLRWAEDLAQRGGYHIACFLAQQVGVGPAER